MSVARDAEGFLQDYRDWTPAIAEALAADTDITLTPAHWEILNAARDFYQRFERSPATRPLLKHLSQTLGPDKASSAYVMQLFTGTPAKIIAKLAGLPKPPNCI